jgi:hypothetical protein
MNEGDEARSTEREGGRAHEPADTEAGGGRFERDPEATESETRNP